MRSAWNYMSSPLRVDTIINVSYWPTNGDHTFTKSLSVPTSNYASVTTITAVVNADAEGVVNILWIKFKLKTTVYVSGNSQ